MVLRDTRGICIRERGKGPGSFHDPGPPQGALVWAVGPNPRRVSCEDSLEGHCDIRSSAALRCQMSPSILDGLSIGAVHRAGDTSTKERPAGTADLHLTHALYHPPKRTSTWLE